MNRILNRRTLVPKAARWVFFCLLGILAATCGWAQPQTEPQALDRIIAIIDEEVILQSEVEAQYRYMLSRGQKDDGTLKCSVFETLLSNYLLLAKARLDSLNVSEAQIENELNRRLSLILSEMGGEENLVKTTGKSVVQLKVELRKEIGDQLLIEEQKQNIFDAIEVTPREVKDYFKSIPQDSLPYLPAEVELSHIVIKPKPSEENKEKTKRELAELRGEIITRNLDFAEMARKHSQDYGSAREGGHLGEFGRGQMVPEFEEVGYNLEPGQISDVFETDYGYHIIKLHERNGDRLVASHILLRPPVTAADEAKAMTRLQQIRKKIVSDSISFDHAARQFSEDRATKETGGMIQSRSGDYRVPMDQLDADLYLKMDNMKVGEISEPMEFIQTQGDLSKVYHIIWLRKKHPPHRANLKDDYKKFQTAAKQAKQMEGLQKWFFKAKKQVFVEIKDNECSKALQNWN